MLGVESRHSLTSYDPWINRTNFLGQNVGFEGRHLFSQLWSTLSWLVYMLHPKTSDLLAVRGDDQFLIWWAQVGLLMMYRD